MTRFLPHAVLTITLLLLAYNLSLKNDPPNSDASVRSQASLESKSGPQHERPIVIPDYTDTLPNSLEVMGFNGLEEFRQGIQFYLDNRQYAKAKQVLLELANQAVQRGDRDELGSALALLGEISLIERNLHTAEAYLSEAVDLFEESGNVTGTAYSYMQLGKIHVTSRQIARKAGQAFDRLLLARFQISRYQYDAAFNNLMAVIDSSLEIDRFGTAASAYQTLSKLFDLRGETYRSEQAKMESAKLYASSGQINKAEKLLDNLQQVGADPSMLFESRTDIAERNQVFQRGIEALRRADNFQQLYNYYRSTGNVVRAWEFRMKATASIAKTSRQVMYHRQPGVIAVLYNSNDDMERAQVYAKQADQLFTEVGLEDWSNRAQDLARRIY